MNHNLFSKIENMAFPQPQTLKQLNETFISEVFTSQTDFERKLAKFGLATLTSFRRRDSRAYKGLLTEFKYQFQKYECINYGTARPQQVNDRSKLKLQLNASISFVFITTYRLPTDLHLTEAIEELMLYTEEKYKEHKSVECYSLSVPIVSEKHGLAYLNNKLLHFAIYEISSQKDVRLKSMEIY